MMSRSSETIAYQVVFRINNANSAEEIGDYTAKKTSESTQGTKFLVVYPQAKKQENY